MSHFLPCRVRALVLVSVSFLLFATLATPAPVGAPIVTIKRFTGLLSNSGPVSQSPGQPLSPTAKWVDFICDPLSLNWKIEVRHAGKSQNTKYINDPHICDHVEIMMFYYNPQIPAPGDPSIGLVDGTAIYIKKIP